MPQDDAQTWLLRAKSALALSQKSASENVYLEDLCFFAHQAAERAIKSIYIFKGWAFRYTHDLEELGTALETHGLSIPTSVKDAVILTRYAVETRYPGPVEPVTDDEYKEALCLAESVIVWADNVLNTEYQIEDNSSSDNETDGAEASGDPSA